MAKKKGICFAVDMGAVQEHTDIQKVYLQDSLSSYELLLSEPWVHYFTARVHIAGFTWEEEPEKIFNQRMNER